MGGQTASWMLVLLLTTVSGQNDTGASQPQLTEIRTSPETETVLQVPNPTRTPWSICDAQLGSRDLKLPLWTGLADSEEDLLFETSELKQCSPSCENRGQCRYVPQLGSHRCVCPLNYTGPTCQNDALPRLATCAESTCRNGGLCSGTSEHPTCHCPENTRGSLCERRIRVYHISVPITQQDQSIPWNADYGKEATETFRHMSKVSRNMVYHALRLGDDELLTRAFVGAEFVQFKNFTVNPIIGISFDFNDSLASLYTQKCILGQLITGAVRLRKLMETNDVLMAENYGMIAPFHFSIQTMNPCTTGNHDCHHSAFCLLKSPAVYVCACKSFTIDVSKNDEFPGRRCVYDGLIIFSFVIVGILLCSMIIIFFGCRRTIWYRYRLRQDSQSHELVNMPSNYEI